MFYCIEVGTGHYLEIDAFRPPKAIWQEGKGNRSIKSWKNFQRWTTASTPGSTLLTAGAEDTLFPGQSCLTMEPKMLDLEFWALAPTAFKAYIPWSQASKTTVTKLFAFQQYTTKVLIPTSCAYISFLKLRSFLCCTEKKKVGKNTRSSGSALIGELVQALRSSLLQDVWESESQALLQHNVALEWHSSKIACNKIPSSYWEDVLAAKIRVIAAAFRDRKWTCDILLVLSLQS